MESKLTIASFLFITVIFSSGITLAEAPVLELIDHERGMKISTPNNNWAISTVQPFAGRSILMFVNHRLKGSLQLRNTPVILANLHAVNTIKKTLKNQFTNISILDDNEGIIIGDTVEAIGFTYRKPKGQNRTLFEQTLWFQYKNVQYRADCKGSDEENFKVIKKDCQKILEGIKLM